MAEPGGQVFSGEFLERAVGAALAAGALILGHYAAGVAATAKADGSPVTVADREAEALIVAALAAAAPGVPVVAEEAMSRGERPEIARRYFLVDPLDGTREFVNRTGEFTVNIALVDDGVPVFGLVHAPVPGRLFVTVAADRAVAARVGDPGRQRALADLALEPIRTRAPDPARLTALSSRSHADRESERFLARFQVAERRRIGSSVKLALIAAGEADLYPRFGPTSAWDIAAGHALVAAAGGAVTRPDGRPLVYGPGSGDYATGPFVVWGRPELIGLAAA